MSDKLFWTIFLGAIAILSLVWALSYSLSGLAWFPGFIIAVFCAIGIMDVNNVGKKEKKSARP